MLIHSPNHRTLRLPNDDDDDYDDDGCMNPRNVPDCFVQQFHLSQHIPLLNLIKYRILCVDFFLNDNYRYLQCIPFCL